MWNEFAEKAGEILTNNSPSNLHYLLEGRTGLRENGKSESLKLIIDGKKVKLDMNIEKVKDTVIVKTIFAGVAFKTTTLERVLSD